MTKNLAISGPVTILDLAVYKGINDLQATAKQILGDSRANDEAIHLLAKLETLLMTPGATEEIERYLGPSARG